jgi:ketosteroid isomerase-like protein
MVVENENALRGRAPDLEDNVELIRRSYRMLEDLRNGDRGAERQLHELVDEHFELHPPAVYPEGAQVFRGPNGLKRWTASTKESWGEWRFELERLIDVGDRVVVLIHVVAQGGQSGVRLERDTAHVWTLAEGKVTRCEVYLDRSEALEALGLQE